MAGLNIEGIFAKIIILNHRQLFFQHLAQTSPAPLALHITRAFGCTLWDAAGKTYTDLIGGISVANIGHSHPYVINAVKEQLEKYMHIMVYGEMIQTPQVAYASKLCTYLPDNLNAVYFTNSGAEAIEGAMKLAKRVTGRPNIVAFNHSYHGSTQGALSIIGSEYFRNAYRPLLPGITHANYNQPEAFEHINTNTACVIVEVVQAEAGVIAANPQWLKMLQQHCTNNGVLLVLDEVQTGFGRTGNLWAFEQYSIVPDILVLGKALGGGMPLGAFIASKELMDSFTENPVLGHITTFGGHPISCTAGLAAFEVLLQENYIAGVEQKQQLFLSLLQHPQIINIRYRGLWMAVEFSSFAVNKQVIDNCIEKGVLTDWFLFADNCLRISPPLSITEAEIKNACAVIIDSLG